MTKVSELAFVPCRNDAHRRAVRRNVQSDSFHNRYVGQIKHKPVPGCKSPRATRLRLAEAAHYLLIPTPTLRSWVCGRYYPKERGRRFFKSLLDLAVTKLFTYSIY